MRQQNVIRATEILSLFGFESPLRAMQLTHEIERLIRWHCQSVNLAGIPFRNRNVGLQKMRPRQIKRQPFVARTYRVVAPMIPGRFFANLPPKDRQRVAMIAITADDSARGITGAEKNAGD